MFSSELLNTFTCAWSSPVFQFLKLWSPTGLHSSLYPYSCKLCPPWTSTVYTFHRSRIVCTLRLAYFTQWTQGSSTLWDQREPSLVEAEWQSSMIMHSPFSLFTQLSFKGILVVASFQMLWRWCYAQWHPSLHFCSTALAIKFSIIRQFPCGS